MAATPKSYDVFFSYDHDDTEWADRLRAALEQRGVRVWIDSAEIRAGERWEEELEKGMKSSRAWTLICTRHALESVWVREERNWALVLATSPDSNLQLVPVLLEDVELPLFLQTRQWVDFRDPARFDERLEELHRCLAAAGAPGAGEPAVPASGAAASPGNDVAVAAQAELDFLDRALHREAQTVREMWGIRIAALAIGLPLSWGLTGLVSSPVLALGIVPVTGLIGWGATVPRMAAARSSQDRLRLLRDGIARCLGRRDAWCEKLQVKFWETVQD
ncbi:MAG TPA: toll/interleukin-1 receptor domain-containing protein [Thermoanaerobaculia bacterium]|nr:toll/interleukin-1 receptor domain-containing protein [Thermoanaerobaculia bacterium]